MKSIIIPAYNEGMRIKRVLENLIDEFPEEEIIVVCDGEDNSEDIIKSSLLGTQISDFLILVVVWARAGH
jgi:glycosyltransferase involved in cell wall biosynthesis